MIIGIDLDHTITALPELFSLLTEALITAGHQVHVITYREIGSEEEVRVLLDELGIRYSALHLPTTACLPPEWKAGLVSRLGIDMMIEDSPEVLARMPGGVKRLWVCDPEAFDLDLCLRGLREEWGRPTPDAPR